jgi:hypothetical protein
LSTVSSGATYPNEEQVREGLKAVNGYNENTVYVDTSDYTATAGVHYTLASVEEMGPKEIYGGYLTALSTSETLDMSGFTNQATKSLDMPTVYGGSIGSLGGGLVITPEGDKIVCSIFENDVLHFDGIEHGDLSSAVYQSSKSSIAGGSGRLAMTNRDGTDEFVWIQVNNTLKEITTDPGFDFSTFAVSGDTFDTDSFETPYITALQWMKDGNSIIFAGTTNHTLFTLPSDTPYSLGNTVANGKRFDLGFDAYGIAFRNNYKNLLILDQDSQLIRSYYLPDPDDISTLVEIASNRLDISSFTTDPRGMCLSPDEEYIYIGDNDNGSEKILVLKAP